MLDRNRFPNLGRVKVLIGSHSGEIGQIIFQDDQVIRVAFESFWSRPDGMDPEEADDNGWYFPQEWEPYNG